MVIQKINSERDRMKQMSHIRNLLAIAITDGSFDQDEKKLIFEIGERSGLSKQELEQIEKTPASVTYVQPDSNEEKIEQLYDLVLLILVNNEIAQNETSLCKTFALKLGIELNTANKLIPALIDAISKGTDSETAVRNLRNSF